MLQLYGLIERVGRTRTSVLLHGESGTGKERVARALHEASPRRRGPWVPVDCASIPEALMEDELFGHASGAYTGAQQRRTGLFRSADGGTLFLDEVAELAPSAQARLLRVLEQRTVRPLGQDAAVPIDVRLVAATHVDLAEAVRDGRFREDLYYRLRVVTLKIPPLRDRGEDVLLLAEHFLREQSELHGRELRWDDAFEASLLAWRWPGNVRELRNVIEAASAMRDKDTLDCSLLPDEMRGSCDAPPPTSGELLPLAVVERRHIEHVLSTVDGNQSRAARILGIDRKTLHSRLRRWSNTE